MNVSLDTQLNVQDDYLILKVKAVQSPRILLDVEINQCKIYGVSLMSIKAGNQVKISIDPRDSFGNKARVENTVWQLNDPSLGSLVPSTDGVSVTFSSVGKVGQAVVEVAADADLSEGIRNIAGSVAIDIEPGEAVDLGVFVEPIVVAVEVVGEPTAPVQEPVAAPVETVATEAPVQEPVAAPVETVATEAPVEPVAPVEEVAAPVDTPATDVPVDIVEAQGVSGEPAADVTSTETSADLSQGTATDGTAEEQPIV